MLVEAMAKISEFTLKGIEKISGASTEVRNRIADLDSPLNMKFSENVEEEDKPQKRLENLDIPLNKTDFEYDEAGYRPLTQDEKQELKENMKWSDKSEGLDGCKINEEGVIKYPCRNEGLAGTTNPISGIEYEKRIVEINGYQVEVVMPKFESVFDAELPEGLNEAKDREQFKECNKQLYEKIQEDPELRKQFTSEQIEQIKDGMTNGGAPDGYTWHHDAEVGKMQLVDSDIHADSRHTGGKTLWGGGNSNR